MARAAAGAAVAVLILGGWVQGTPRSYRELRYTGVVGQTDWYTCGPAAAATLLQHYFGVPATEAELLALAVHAMDAVGQAPDAGISAWALRQALAAKGLPTRGYRLELRDLAAYFHQGGLPVILHVTRPEVHYVVAVGTVGDKVLLADPSFGRHLLSWHELAEEKGFSGVALVPVPGAEHAEQARQLQATALESAAARWAMLRRWGGRRL